MRSRIEKPFYLPRTYAGEKLPIAITRTGWCDLRSFVFHVSRVHVVRGRPLKQSSSLMPRAKMAPRSTCTTSGVERQPIGNYHLYTIRIPSRDIDLTPNDSFDVRLIQNDGFHFCLGAARDRIGAARLVFSLART